MPGLRVWFFLFLFCLTGPVFGKKVATFPQMNRPNDVIIDGDCLFISDCPSVYIYSFKDGDIQLKKKFGKEGNGPGEFKKVSASFKINVQPGYIFVNARRKIAYFTRTGEFIREKNTAAAGYSFFALNDKIIGRKVVPDNNKLYMTIKMFNSDLKEECELTRQLDVIQPGVRNIKAYTVALEITAGGNKIFVVPSVDFIVKVFDSQGNPLFTIDDKNRTKRLKVENKHKEDFHNSMRVRFPEYQRFKERVVFPEYFPAIKRHGLKYDYDGGNEKIYVVTWKKKGPDAECFVYDTKGKFIKRAFLPIKDQNAVRFYPYQIKDSKLYQLIENENTEEWELHVTPIDSH
jgi:hypothetical protein